MSLKWKPKSPEGSTIGVPERGFIKVESFNQKDLDAMIARANNRKLDVHSFLLSCGLVPVREQVEMFDAELKSEPIKEAPPKRVKKVVND